MQSTSDFEKILPHLGEKTKHIDVTMRGEDASTYFIEILYAILPLRLFQLVFPSLRQS